MASEVTYTQIDHSNEPTRTTLRFADIVDAATLAAVNTAIATMQTDIAAITNSTIKQRKVSLATVKLSNLIPASPDSQRERKLVVYYQDNVTFETYTVEIGCADVTALTIPPGTDEVTLADAGVMQTFYNDFNANVLSKNGNAVTIIRAVLVGRNL